MEETIEFEGTKTAVKYAEHKRYNINYYISKSRDTVFRAFARKLPGDIAGLCPDLTEGMDGLNIIFDDDEHINAYQIGNKIVITFGLLEHLWLSCYLHLSIYRQIEFGNPNVIRKKLKIKWGKDMKACAQKLYHKAYFNVWPDELPAPNKDYDIKDGTNASLASELAIHSFTCVILHELKHYLDWKNSVPLRSAMQTELEADNYAIEHFLQIPNEDNMDDAKKKHAYEKRLLALIEMGAFLAHMETLSPYEDTEHPNGYYRIHNIIKKKSCIFDCIDDLEYNPSNDRYDIRPSLQYAALIIALDLNFLLPDGSRVKQSSEKLLSGEYDSPFFVYKTLIFFLMSNVIDIHEAASKLNAGLASAGPAGISRTIYF